MRPQGTDFAQSARMRDSVLNLGSIMHIQYYFARTGLLDGKGGRLSKKDKNNRGTMNFSAKDTSFLAPTDADSSYASTGSSPELQAQGHGGTMVESPTREEYDNFGDDEDDPHMLPPTTSTYKNREYTVEHPPTLEELKIELKKSLGNAAQVLLEAKNNLISPPVSPARQIISSRPLSAGNEPMSPISSNDIDNGWYQIQGMHILDIMTLAIRAAKMYYTAHDQPARLSVIKSERKIRADLLSVLDVLKRMAARDFATGMRAEERETMEKWVEDVYDMLKKEEAMVEADRAQRASWTWLDGSWVGKEIEREYAFMKSMDPDVSTLPTFISVDQLADDQIPAPFHLDLHTGLRLVKLHNAIVKKSKRPFGAIDKMHTDFAKPYRMAENLRYWIKAAELRWELVLKVDVPGVVAGTDRVALKGFEDAIWKWCGKLREEISVELRA